MVLCLLVAKAEAQTVTSFGSFKAEVVGDDLYFTISGLTSGTNYGLVLASRHPGGSGTVSHQISPPWTNGNLADRLFTPVGESATNSLALDVFEALGSYEAEMLLYQYDANLQNPTSIRGGVVMAFDWTPTTSGECICEHLQTIEDKLQGIYHNTYWLNQRSISNSSRFYQIREAMYDGEDQSVFQFAGQSHFATDDGESVFWDSTEMSVFVDDIGDSAFLNDERLSVFKDRDGESVFLDPDGKSYLAGAGEFHDYMKSEKPETGDGEEPEENEQEEFEGELGQFDTSGLRQPWDPGGYNGQYGGGLGAAYVPFNIPGVGQRVYGVNMVPTAANLSNTFGGGDFSLWTTILFVFRSLLTGAYIFWLGFKGWEIIT